MPPPGSAGSSPQVPALTSFRFFAALLVLLFHFSPRGPGWEVVAGEGHVGVGLFFVLSGFLITSRYALPLAEGRVGLGEYFLRRAARVLPLYYAVFILSQLLSSGRLGASLPEWTLTQALFGESLHELVVPTSWSLTVEECFYVLAPLLFLALAAARRRMGGRPLLPGALVLVLFTLGLFAAGVALWTLLDGRGPGFLRRPEDVTIHTLFGRFHDFAAGALAALALSGSRRVVPAVLGRPLAAASATIASTALVVVAQWGMHAAGGISGEAWARAWAWNLLLAPAAAVLILSLTSPVNALGRALGWRPLVYLGKISYALYLIQLTPLGKGVVFRFLPAREGALALAVLVAGLVLVSALLYELVEEPARKLVLRLAGRGERGEAGSRAPSRGREALATMVLAVAAVLGLAGWTSARLEARQGPVTLQEALDTADPADVLVAGSADLRPARDVLLVALPAAWRQGWGEDLRPPGALWVFADGVPVPFSRREERARGAAAFYRGPRTEHLALRPGNLPYEVTLVRRGAWLEAQVGASRLLQDPAAALVPASVALLLLTGVALLFRRQHGPTRIPQAETA